MSFLNPKRPPLFCPGCGHEKVVRSLDKALQDIELSREQVVLVTDIGCSGLFDTFFDTHALHGLHGRALTYATGIKMARPEVTVIVIMGDGGLGIGGAHFLASCRRNLDINLLVLNNFNYGMTGGQCSATTPVEARTASGFLNRLETPLDVCLTATSLGTSYTGRFLATDNELAEQISSAIAWKGFSVLDIWGLCPGRHLKNNPTRLKELELEVAQLNNRLSSIPLSGEKRSALTEYGNHYRKLAEQSQQNREKKGALTVSKQYEPLLKHRSEILILGAAGQYINTAGEVLALAAMSSGLNVTLKNDYPITVLRGHSISEAVIDTVPIGFTGLTCPSIILCVAQEGVDKKRELLTKLSEKAVIIKASGLSLPDTKAKVTEYDMQGAKVPKGLRGIAALTILAIREMILNTDMLLSGIGQRYGGRRAEEAASLVRRIAGEGIQ